MFVVTPFPPVESCTKGMVRLVPFMILRSPRHRGWYALLI